MQKKAILEEAELLKQMRNGNIMAFEYIYDAYYTALYFHVYNKLRDREVAKDIVQDLFATLWEKRGKLEVKIKLSSYLYASVRNRVLDHISRQQSKEKYLSSLTDYIEAKHSLTDHRLRERMLEEQIDEVLTSLPPRLQEVFELSREQFLSHKEISQKLNLSEQSVRSYIKQALRVFRARLGMVPWGILIFCVKYF